MDLHINNIRAGWGKKEVLHDFSATVKSGSFTVVLGKNGCGKSTLAATLCGGLGYKGEILFGETDMRKYSFRDRAKTVSFVPQIPKRASVTVEDLVAFGRTPYLGTGQRLRPEDKDLVEAAISGLELESIRRSTLDRISGGELRRAYIAMALAQDTPITVLDEPTAHMDENNRIKILRSLKRLNKEQGKTLLVIMHSISDALRYADELIIVSDGRAVARGTPEEISEGKYIEKAFGVQRYIGEIWGVPESEERTDSND